MKNNIELLSQKYNNDANNHRLSTIKLTESNQNAAVQNNEQPFIERKKRNRFLNQGTGSFPTNAVNTELSI